MIPLETLLNAYIDANIVLAVAALAWLVTRAILNRTPLRRAYGTQLRLIYAVLVAVACAPLFVTGVLATGGPISVNLSDIVVAQYLDGRFAMAPSRFEQLLMTRDIWVSDIVTLGSATGKAIAAALIGGIILSILRTAANMRKVQRLIRRSYCWRRVGNLHIQLTDATHVPFSTRGLRGRYIVLPSGMLSQNQDMKIALAHELQHIRQGDLTWELVLECLRPLFFFNPAVYLWKRDVEQLRELACDQRVMQRTGLTARDYGNCLLRVCMTALRRDRSAQIALPSVALLQVRAGFGRGRAERFLRLRVNEMLLSHQAASPRWLIPALLIPLALAIGLSAVSIQRSGDWSQDRLMLSAIVNLERLNQRNGLN